MKGTSRERTKWLLLILLFTREHVCLVWVKHGTVTHVTFVCHFRMTMMILL